MRATRRSPLPSLDRLHERHPGFNRPLCEAYAQAAAICLDESWISPAEITVAAGEDASLRELSWDSPDARAHASWANTDDATRDGAYSLGLAAMEAELGLVALMRSDIRTGCDYYVGLPGSDLEDSYRLEISGLRRSEAHEVRSRLREKVRQTRRPGSSIPAYACTVGFRAKLIAIASDRDAER
jgi:hypothetical protein